MPALNFPTNPVVDDTYTAAGYIYKWDGTKWMTVQSGEKSMNQIMDEHKSSVNQHAISGVAGLREELDAIKAAGGDAVLDVKWLTARTPMRTGYTAGDGQTLPRALYPDALAAIQAGLVPVCTDAEWLADPAKRGCFTLGDGNTTFRVPDYNGKSVGSFGAIFQRGDGLNSAGVAGEIQRDAIQKVTGSWQDAASNANVVSTTTGVVRAELLADGLGRGGGNVVNNFRYTIDLSREARTATETRSVNVTGCWGVKLFGAVQNVGSADAAALATAVADLAARVSVLEQRKSTCLVNATGTGAPHETVVTQLPGNIQVSSRYVLPNPFGVNTPVECWAEVFANNRWSRTGFVLSESGYGASASYVQGEGIVVQTGGNSLVATSALSGSGHGISGGVASAPCRVFVRKLEA